MLDYVIIGAPKCGTTTIADWLRNHPDIFMPTVKEPHFFSSRIAEPLVSNRKEYNNLFSRGKSNRQKCGEASVWYLYDLEALKRLRNECPQIKVIACVRDAPGMVKSLYIQKRKSMQESSESLDLAWSLSSRRQQGEPLYVNGLDTWQLAYQDIGLLGKYCTEASKVFNSSNFRILSVEDMRESEELVRHSLCDYLKIEKPDYETLGKSNVASELRSKKLGRILSSIGKTKRRLGMKGSFGIASRINYRRNTDSRCSPQTESLMIDHFKKDKLEMTILKEKFSLLPHQDRPTEASLSYDA